MIALIQRVESASVEVDGARIGAIDSGMLALIAVLPPDNIAQAERLVQRLLDLRIFADAAGRMNRSLRETGGGLLLVPQFTLAADTSGGNRPSFTGAAPPAQARTLFDALVALARAAHAPVATGRFGADMRVSLINDGPVTLWLEV